MEGIPIHFDWNDRKYEGTANPVKTDDNKIYFNVIAPGIEAAIEPLASQGLVVRWVDHDTKKENELTFILGAAVERAEISRGG